MGNSKKLYMVVCMVVLGISIIAGVGTYAWYSWTTDSENETKIVTSLGAATVYYDAGSDIIDTDLKPVATKEDGIVKEITISASKETAYKISFNLYLDVITLGEGLKHESFRYQLYQGDTLKKEGNFTQEYLNANLETCETNSTSHIVLISDETITTTQLEYTLFIWIDGTNYTNPDTMQNQSLALKLHADGENAVLGHKVPLVQTISDLYNNASKTTVTNNNIAYNYATSVSLMNDRLGNKDVGVNDGNIRYYGANPNNYIDIGDVYTVDTEINNLDKFYLIASEMGVTDSDSCYAMFNCETNYEALQFTDQASCEAGLPTMLESMFKTDSIDGVCGTTVIPAGTPKLYRIIGLFKDVELSDGTTKDLVKIMRDDPIGNFAWDLTYNETDDSSEYANNWRTSTLNNILNTNYYNLTTASYAALDWEAYIESEYQTLSYYNTTKDFSSIGLNSSLKDKIETVNWKLGGWNTSDVYANQVYGYERGETVYSGMPTDWEGKIALMYPSDYGYATDLSQCSSTLMNYETTGCYDNDWIYDGYTVEWMLTPYSGDSVGAWFVGYDGRVYYDFVILGFGVRPVFHLSSELGVVSGNGSKDSPYVIR